MVRRLAVIALLVACGIARADLPEVVSAEAGRIHLTLKEKGDPAPYFTSVRVLDQDMLILDANDGALRANHRTRERWASVQVRVEAYGLDSTHRLRGQSYQWPFDEDSTRSIRVPYDGPPGLLRAHLWLAAEEAYNFARDRWQKVRTDAAVSAADERKAADFSEEVPTRAVERPAALTLQSAAWEARVRRWSKLLARPTLLDSSVALQAVNEYRVVATSEGGLVAQPRVHFRLTIAATARAADGMELSRFHAFDAHSESSLPDETVVVAMIQRVADDTLALANAPKLEPYRGPAILSGAAAGVFFHEIFGHRIEGHRQKDASEGQTFTDRVGKRVLPLFLSVSDDPGMAKYGDVELNGHYRFDDEGVASQRVSVVERGVLKSFLLSRSPVPGFLQSNGHGRAEIGKDPVGRQGNLIVQAARSVTNVELKRQLVAELKKKRLPFGLYFEDISGGYTFTTRGAPQSFKVTPVMVFQVFSDGRPDRLVRGVDLIGTPLTSFSRIMAAGEAGVFNGHCGAESGWVPVSAVSPSLLVAEIETQRKEVAQARPPILPPPTKNTDSVLAALAAEVARARGLSLAKLSAPLFIALRVDDRWVSTLEASGGGLLSDLSYRQRSTTADVRVGTHTLDSSEFNPGFGRERATRYGAFEGIGRHVARDAWLAIDRGWKIAHEVLAQKRARIESVPEKRRPADSSAVPAVLKDVRPAVDAPAVWSGAGRAVWRERIRALSERARGPSTDYSQVCLHAVAENRYLVTSEGTALSYPQTSVALHFRARGQTDDGATVRMWRSWRAESLEQLPSQSRIQKEIAEASRQLSALRASRPAAADYVGPVLLRGEAAAQFVAHSLVPRLSGHRPPMNSDGVPPLRHGFENRVNRRVLPTFLSALDRPSLKSFEGQRLLGAYEWDDEGVRPQDLSVVTDGFLRELPMSRRPRPGVTRSNGHARAAFRDLPTAHVSNLILKSARPVAEAALRERLLKVAEQQGLKFAYVIELLDSPAVTLAGVDEQQQVGNRPAAPILVYRVQRGKKPVLVRGLQFAGISHRTFKDIVAAGKGGAVHHLQSNYGGGEEPTWQSEHGIHGAGGVPLSVVSPSLLFEELELTRGSGPAKRPHLLK